MKEKLRYIHLAVFYLITTSVHAQVWIRPNEAMKSPETLIIDRIETTRETTTFFFTLENRIKDGYFCAEKSIYIVYPDGSRSKLLRAEGIPVCPDYHSFREVGEKISFSLVFPPIKANTPWVDMVEECSSGCMFFYGLTLDQSLNTRLDELFVKAERSSPGESIGLFKSMIDELAGKNLGIEGLLFINIINASLEAGDKIGAAVWYKRMLTSGAPRVSYYIKFLNDKGVKF